MHPAMSDELNVTNRLFKDLGQRKYAGPKKEQKREKKTVKESLPFSHKGCTEFCFVNYVTHYKVRAYKHVSQMIVKMVLSLDL